MAAPETVDAYLASMPSTPRSNRQTRLVRFGCSRSRDIWVQADLPAPGLDERSVDRLLGLVAEAALAVRGLRPPAGGP